MNKRKFIKNSLIMTIIMLISQVLSALLNVYLSNKLSAEGMGIYHLTLNVFIFFASFCTTGVMITVTRIVSELHTLGKFSTAKLSAIVCCCVLALAGTAAGILLFTLAETISVKFLGDARCTVSLKVLSVSLPFMAVSSGIRGYFLALRAAVRSCADQLCEALVRIAVCYSIVVPFSARGLEYACCAAAVSLTVSEIASFIISLVLFIFGTSNTLSDKTLPRKIKHKILSIILPVTASSVLRSGLGMTENTLIPLGLQKHSMSVSQSLSTYGIIHGMALPAISYPYILISSFSSMIIPEMSEAHAKGNISYIKRVSKKVLISTLTFTLPMTVLFYFSADMVSCLLYGGKSAGVYIRILSLTIPFIYTDHVVDALLKGLNEQLHYFLYNIIDSITRTILALFLIPKYGVPAIIVIIFISSILNSTLSALRLLKVTNLEITFKDVTKPILAVVCTFLLCCMVF